MTQENEMRVALTFCEQSKKVHTTCVSVYSYIHTENVLATLNA